MALREVRAAEHDQAVEELDREIREFVRQEVVTNPGRQPENESELVAGNINSLLRRVTRPSRRVRRRHRWAAWNEFPVTVQHQY